MEFNQLSFIINEHQIMKNEKRNLFFTAAIKIPDHFKTNTCEIVGASAARDEQLGLLLK